LQFADAPFEFTVIISVPPPVLLPKTKCVETWMLAPADISEQSMVTVQPDSEVVHCRPPSVVELIMALMFENVSFIATVVVLSAMAGQLLLDPALRTACCVYVPAVRPHEPVGPGAIPTCMPALQLALQEVPMQEVTWVVGAFAEHVPPLAH
jgi:hypothetical protein